MVLRNHKKNRKNFRPSTKFSDQSLQVAILNLFLLSLPSVSTVAQCFGNVPVMGVLDKDLRNLKFKWRTFRTIYSLIYMVICFFEVCLMVLKGIVKGISIVNVGEWVINFFWPESSC